MMKRTLGRGAVLAVCSAALLSLAGADFTLYNVMPYSPGREAQCAADCREYARRTGCDLVLYSLSLHPEGKPAMEKAERLVASYRALKRELEGSEVRLGVLVQSILGHWPRVDRETENWTRTVNVKGEKVRFCPDDPGFAGYIDSVFAMLATERPAFILTDDDVRAYSHDAECFCPRHIAEFNARMGTELTEAEVRERVAAASQDDSAYKTFLSVQRGMMERLARRFRAAIDSVDPSIPAGVCMGGEETFLVGPLARTVAAKWQTPMVRLANGSYMERYQTRLPESAIRTLGFAELYRDSEIDLLCEADTCPHNFWSKSALSFFTHLELSAFCGLKGAKVWYVGAHKGQTPVSRGYVDVLARNRGLLDALSREVGETTGAAGVAVPSFSRFPNWHLAGDHREMPINPGTFAQGVFIPFGIPFRAEGDFTSDGVYVVSSTNEVKRFTDAELDQVFSHKVLVTGEAALALTRRGRRDLIGLSAERRTFRYNVERDAATKTRYAASPSDRMPFFSEISEGAEIVSHLGYSPYAGAAEFEAVAPGAVLWRNALGGTVAVCAYHAEMMSLHLFSDERKAYVLKLLDRLCGGPLPFVCGNSQDVLVLARNRRDGGAAVMVVNLNSEPITSLRLRAPGAAEVSILSSGGTWESQNFSRDGEWIDIPVPIAFYEAKVFRILSAGVEPAPSPLRVALTVGRARN